MWKLSCKGLTALLGVATVLGVTARPARSADDKWATVKGQVVFAGAAPAPTALNVTKDQANCLSKGPIHSEELVVNPENKGVKNVFVWITTSENGKPPIAPGLEKPREKEVFLDQPTCAFIPHALAVREGQDVVMKNSAPISHNVNWSGGPKNPGDNKILPAGKELKMSPKLKASKAVVSVTCNIHGWMKGWIRVFDHPYFAVTDADGKFEIDQAPVGSYIIWYWSDTGWKDGAAGANGFPLTIKSGTNDLDKVEWKPTK
jgi:plastocyanin